MKTKTIIIVVVAVLLAISLFVWGSDILLSLEQSLGKFITRLILYFICFAAGWIVGRRELKKKLDGKK